MSTRPCEVCGRAHDERFCPYCYGRFVDGELPFDKIPERLEEFYDSGLEKLSLTYEIWQDFEKIRRKAVAEMQHARGVKSWSTEDWEAFCNEVNERAKAEVNEVIDKSLPILRRERDFFQSSSSNLEDFKIKF